jgi:ribonuclease-3
MALAYVRASFFLSTRHQLRSYMLIRRSCTSYSPNLPDGLPILPALNEENLRLKVFTHRSFYARPSSHFEDSPEDPSPDNETLEHLGDAVVNMCAAWLLQQMYPHLRVGPATVRCLFFLLMCPFNSLMQQLFRLQKIRALLVANPNLAQISVHYHLPDYLRINPAQAVTLRASVHVQGKFFLSCSFPFENPYTDNPSLRRIPKADTFEAYVGGLFVDQGLEVVKEWIFGVLKPYAEEAYSRVRAEHGMGEVNGNGTPVKVKSEPDSKSGINGNSIGSLSPPTTSATASIPLSPAIDSGHLSYINQYFSQQGKYVDWRFLPSEGTKTTPVWVVEAYINNVKIGSGKAPTKKGAKNEAARQALQAMGVIVRGC